MQSSLYFAVALMVSGTQAFRIYGFDAIDNIDSALGDFSEIKDIFNSLNSYKWNSPEENLLQRAHQDEIS